MTDSDTLARREALNPSRSFCVTAPAGSGKTELLTQRVLALLARVQRPEQVLAITFTRKAAAEMRDRLVEKIEQARDGSLVTESHEQITRDLALAVLAHAQDQRWSLDPEQFNVRTIDSLCSDLTGQMPIISALGGRVDVTDQSRPLFEMAVSALLSRSEEANSIGVALRALLLHFDNDWQVLGGLLVRLLERRGDWGRRLGMHYSPEQSERDLLATMAELTQGVIARVALRLGKAAAELESLANIAAQNLDLPAVVLSTEASALAAWQQASDLLVKKDGDWRSAKGIRKTIGFPTGSNAEKSRLGTLLDTCRQADLLELITELRRLPLASKHHESWELVLHLSQLLPVLLAQLLLVFQREGKVDYTHIALAAETALGSDEAPTDLALRLDYQIEHILIDEFQDTSDQQFHLLQKLTRGWAEHNHSGRAPRTLFLVGDGMQSIYGFRYANVSLFLRARDHGVGGIELDSLALSHNFRSQKGLVDWVNDVFAQLLPAADDLSRGRVSHSPAQATHGRLPGEAIASHIFPASDGLREATFIAQTIVELRTREPDASIVILVRARRHAVPIIEALRAAEVPFIGRDLESLSQTPTVGDLLSLCRWLADPSDEVAALALLRAPFCGLPLAAIHALWQQARPLDLRHALRHAPSLLPSNALKRSEHLLKALDWAAEHRDRLSLPVWIEQIWLRLEADRVTAAGHHEDAIRFFALLREAEMLGVGLNIDWLRQRLDRLYARHPAVADAVQLMTVHKSKGLQFDYVFMPALHKSAAGNDRALLRWHLHIQDGHYSNDVGGLLIAADDRADKHANSLYSYLNWLQSERDAAELRRLLYVGITRAKSRVWLTGEAVSDRDWPAWPSAKTPMGILRTALEPDVVFHDLDAEPLVAVDETTIVDHQFLRRLPDSCMGTRKLSSAAITQTPMPITVYRSSNRDERILGIVVHRVLERIADEVPIPEASSEAVKGVIERGLRQAGFSAERLQPLREQAETMIGETLNSDDGRWVLSPHQDPHNEWVLWSGRPEPRKRIIDRAFIDALTDTRWIIDYKTSTPQPDETMESFLIREIEHYGEQLADYHGLLTALEAQQRPVKCALFFVALGRLIPVEPRSL